MLKTVTSALMAFTAISSTASAATLIAGDNSLDEQIFSTGTQTGSTIFGVTKNTSNSVTFYSSTSALHVDGQGYAQVHDSSVDTTPWTTLKVSLTDGGGFTAYEFSAQYSSQVASKKDPALLTIGYDLIGGSGTTWLNLNPINFQNAGLQDWQLKAGVGETFSSIYFSSNKPIDQIKQNDITLAPTSAVPEPHSWAMMIAGFGLVGVSLRRSRRNGAVATLA